MSNVTIYPLADLHYLIFLNQLMAIRSSRGFSHLWPGAFHVFYKRKKDTTYMNESGRKKNKQVRTWVSSKRKKGEVLALYCGFERVSERNSRTATRNADSSSREGWRGLWVHWSPLFLQQPPLSDCHLSLTDANFFLLLTALGLCFSSSSSGLVRNLARKPFCVSLAQKQTKGSSNWHSPTHPTTERMPNILPP